MNRSLLAVSFLVLTSLISKAQINSNDFEAWNDEHEYVQTNWASDGFTTPWVNGFNQSRCFVDDAYAQSGTKSLRVLYPAGGVGPSETGAQAPLQFAPKDEVYMSYWLRFSDDFDWGGTSEGGKLPGFGSGDNCSGGSSCDGTNGFSSRLMWRTGGKAVLYFYHMDKPATYGEDIDLINTDNSNVVFEKGKWYQVAQRVKVNTGNNYDGEVDVWINGDLVLSLTGYRLVNNGDKVDNLYFSTFHGGSGSTWAPGNDCHIWYDDIVVSENRSDVFSTLCQDITFPETFPKACAGVTKTVDVGLNEEDYTINWYKGNDPSIYSVGSEVNISESNWYIVERMKEGCQTLVDSFYILPAQLLSVNPDTMCEEGVANLSVNGSGEYTWFETATDGVSINDGNEYDVSVFQNTTYYVEEEQVDKYKLGRSVQTGVTWNTSNLDAADKRHQLTNFVKVTLDAVTVNSTNVGSIVNLRILASNETTVLHEFQHKVTQSGMNRVPVGVELDPGTYKFDLVGSTKSVHFETENSTYPLTVDGVLELNCNVDYQCTGGWYGFFYDWEFSVGSESECRTPIEAIIDPQNDKCSILSLENKANEFSVFPNPTTGVTYLSNVAAWEVYSSKGMKLKEGKGTEIDLSDNEKGMYILKTEGGVFSIIHQ